MLGTEVTWGDRCRRALAAPGPQPGRTASGGRAWMSPRLVGLTRAARAVAPGRARRTRGRTSTTGRQDMATSQNSFGARGNLDVGGQALGIYRLGTVADRGG